MKIDRQIGILSILLKQDRVTVPYLAERFEVSVRTINRDIEDLCRAGIPVATFPGRRGGVSIMEGYRMDKTLLTSSDMQAILTGLQSLDSVCGTNRYQQLMEKLSVGNKEYLAANQHIWIDLSSWYKSSLAPKISLLQEAIEEQKRVIFRYFSPRAEGLRGAEPYLLLFRWSSWYLWAYCPERKGWRLFKLNRMLELKITGEHYEKQLLQMPELSEEKVFPPSLSAKVLLKPAMKWRLIEEFGLESFQEQEDGMLLFSFGFSDRDQLFGWLLSLGDQGKLLEPEELVTEFAALTKQIRNLYEKP